MQISLGHGCRTSLENRVSLRQELSLKIEFSKMMAVPDEVMATVLGAIAYNPQNVESTLQERKKAGLSNLAANDPAQKVQSVYSSILPSGGNPPKPKGSKRGMILAPNLESLEPLVTNYSVEVTPDVTYIARKSNKPEIVFSDHLVGVLSLQLAIDSEVYPETAKLFRVLQHYDSWKRGELRRIYPILGDERREFFEEFNFRRLTRYVSSDLARSIGLSETTISRILSNRWVEARDLSGNKMYLYAKDLFITRDDLFRFISLDEINRILQKEFQEKKAYSDSEIAQQLHGAKRRTISKYRELYQIPTTTVRQRDYDSGTRAEPYLMPPSFARPE